MKSLLVALLTIVVSCAHAQYAGQTGSFRMSAGYTHDFPGLNGYTVSGDYLLPVTEQFQGNLGVKYADMTGFPRTQTVNEYTKAFTVDFNFFWVPLQNDDQLLRIGLGYSFSFYHIKRSYPVIVENNGNKNTIWPAQLNHGRTTGINLIAEYEHRIPGSGLSIGVRGALYKAYDRTFYIGPVFGIDLP